MNRQEIGNHNLTGGILYGGRSFKAYAILLSKGDKMAKIGRLKPGDKVESIDKDSPHFGKTGVYIKRELKRGKYLKTQIPFEEIYLYVRMDDTDTVVTFTNLTKSLINQVKKL